MTAQISNQIKYKGREYSVFEIMWDVSSEGFDAEMWHTANYRGWMAVFEIVNDRLFLRQLRIKHIKKEGGEPRQLLWGEVGVVEENGITRYEVNKLIEYTGKIDLLDDLADELYRHQGFQEKWKFRRWIEIDLDKGVVCNFLDKSLENKQRIDREIEIIEKEKCLRKF